MSMTETQIVNWSLSKIGGAGDQASGSGFIADIDDAEDVLSVRCKTLFPICRQKVITDLAILHCPFRETVKYADLGDDLKQNDVAITSIAVGATPTFAVTITTAESHGYTTGDTVMLFDIEGTGGRTALNGVLKTITVTTTTAFTLDGTTGAAAWVHTADTGISSDCPEVLDYEYAFTLPTDCLAVVKQIAEDDKTLTYQFEVVLNRALNGRLFLTNDLSNEDADSAYIQYVIDQTDTTLFSFAFIECLATYLAAELCPIVGKDLEMRQQMLLEYDTLSIPQAQAANQSQLNNYAKTVPDYLGGRS